MDDIEFAEDGGSIRGDDHLLQMVNDDLIAAVGTEGCLDGGCDGSAGIDVAEDGAIFRVVAVRRREEVLASSFCHE